MILAYEAVDGSGRATSDIVEAANAREAGDMLRARGLYVTHIAEKRSLGALEAARAHAVQGGKLPLKTLALFTRQMTMLLRAGSGVVPAISAIRRQMRKPQQAVLLEQVVADLEEGAPLTEALRKWKSTFSAVYCAIIAAGEASGMLTEMFDRLSLMVGKQRAMRNKIIGALTYPALLIIMSLGILLVLLFFVLPRFSDMFVQLGVEAPVTTQVLLASGAFVRGYWAVILAVAVLLVVGMVLLFRSGTGRQWLTDIQHEAPFLGKLKSRLTQAQVFRTMGTLLESQVGLLETMELARETTRSRQFKKLFDGMEETITSGGQPSLAFEESGVIEPYVCQALRTGEDSGNLGGAMSYCADLLDETNTELINTMTRLIEPAILIVMGVLVGGVAISLFVPLFDLTSAMR